MKKILAVCMSIAILFTFAACKIEKNSKDYSGTWEADYVEYEGSKFTLKEWENLEGEDLSGFCAILKSGGKAYVYDDGYEGLVNWLNTEDSIMIGEKKGAVVDGKIYLYYNGNKLYLKKTSDNQEIPNEAEEESLEEELTSDESTQASTEESSLDNTDTSEVETVAASAVGKTDWKQFLKDYEAWVDDYIKIIKKYNANPNDMTIFADYTKMLSKSAEWAERADEIEEELAGTDEELEYSLELIRIAGKLSTAIS